MIRRPRGPGAGSLLVAFPPFMLQDSFRLINEEFHSDSVLPGQMDSLWAMGWRHFGTHFHRYNVGFVNVDLMFVLPLRIRLSRLDLSKGKRRVLRRNADLDVTIGPARITDEDHELFDRHKTRFTHSVPDSILSFMSPEPDGSPCACMEVRVREAGRLVAVSYFDVDREATSGVYGMFEPSLTDRSLGIFTMLKEIEWSVATGRTFYYQGYAYEEPSFYDYKKRFRGTEAFDWRSTWHEFNY